MTKVLVATVKPFAPKAVEELKKVVDEAGYEFILLEKYADQSDFVAAVADVDALIVRSDKTTKEVLDNAKNLKIVVRGGAGYDNIDLQAATVNNVVVMNTPGQNSNAVAELILGMMVFMARNGYNGKPGTELKGKKFGLHAYGNVGKNVARIAKGFGMDVFAFDPYIPKEAIESDGVVCVDSAEELYRQCQYVSLHIPANEETIGSIDTDLLSLMPENAVLLNAARKEVICETCLLEMYKRRDDFAYAADIAPDCKDEIAEKYAGRYFFTPKKMGAQTLEANVNAGVAAATQIRDFLEEGVTTFQVNK
jgi:D-3-phosphoglycerate dehydrogenase